MKSAASLIRGMIFLAMLLPDAVLSCAALDWKTRELSLTTAPFQTIQEAAFEFTNRGGKTVAIREVSSNCDCLDVSADRMSYAPGESGVIRFKFTVGDRLGQYERQVKVVTDESPEPVRLLVRIEVPELVTMTPRSVAWKLHETATEKTIDLEVIPGVTINFTRVLPTNADFSARLETLVAGRRYRVYLQPTATTQPANAAFRIFGRATSGQEVIVSTYGNIR